MKTKAIKILGMILLLSMAIPAVYAKGPTGKAGKSSVAHLYLVQKDSNWDVIDGALYSAEVLYANLGLKRDRKRYLKFNIGVQK